MKAQRHLRAPLSRGHLALVQCVVYFAAPVESKDWTGRYKRYCRRKSQVLYHGTSQVIALFPDSSFELIVGFYMWAPLKVSLLAGDLRVAMLCLSCSRCFSIFHEY